MMDLVAMQRCIPPAQHLVGREHDVGVQHPHCVGEARPAFHRVVDRAAQHLESTADTEHGSPRRSMRADGLIQPPLTQPAQVGDGGLGARQHDNVGRQVRSPGVLPLPWGCIVQSRLSKEWCT